MTDHPHVSDWIRTAARSGLAARAIVYLLIGLLLLRALFLGGGDGDEASPAKAFLAIETEWWGKLALIAIGGGLALYVVWRFLQGMLDLDRKGDDAAARIGRIGMLASGISYGLIAFAAFAVAVDQNDTSGGGGTQETVRWLMDRPFGRWLVGIAGLALGGVGCAQIWRGVTGKWKDGIRLDERTKWLEWISSYAIIGRGLLFIIAAISIIWSGFALSSDEALGLAETLGWLRKQPFGFWLYLASGLVIVTQPPKIRPRICRVLDREDARCARADFQKSRLLGCCGSTRPVWRRPSYAGSMGSRRRRSTSTRRSLAA